jgi:hypothetical protein
MNSLGEHQKHEFRNRNPNSRVRSAAFLGNAFAGDDRYMRVWRKDMDGYLARLGQDEGWLVIFVAEGGRSHRRDNALEIEARLKTEIQTTLMGREITVIRA